MDKKYIRIILISIIVLLAIILCLLIYLSNKPKVSNEQETEYEFNKPLDLVDNNIIIPDNSYLFFDKYGDGEVSSKDIYVRINSFAVKYLPSLLKDLNGKTENEINQYYDNNKSSINQFIEINSSSELVDFISSLNNYDLSNLEVQSMSFEEEIRHSNNYTYANFIIVYKDSAKIVLKIKVYTIQQDDGRNVMFKLLNK